MLQVTHKNVTFIVDPKLPRRLTYPGGEIDIPGPGITELIPGRKHMIIKAGDLVYRFTYNGPKDHSLMEISEQEVGK